MKKLLVFSFLSISVLLGPSVVVISAQTSPRDDACHYQYFNDRRHDASYIEWWYFNFFSEDIQVIFSYPIINPDDILGRGLAGVTAVAYTKEGIVSEANYFPPNQFYASDEKADVRVPDMDPPPNYMYVNEDGSYHIVGNIQGEAHNISWDLIYIPQTGPWFARDREKVGIFPWEVMSWLVYIPGAWVTGTVKIDDNEPYVIAAPGYHDHNWGEWIPTDALWNWAQCYDPTKSLAFEMGDFRFKPVGMVSIVVKGERIVFEKDEYYLIHKRWKYDPENKKYFPVETWLYAENERGRLVVSLQTIETEALFSPLKLAAFLPEVVLYEQTAHYEGQLWKKNDLNKWELFTLFSGNGFKEYTALLF
jgi:hypothetical protein